MSDKPEKLIILNKWKGGDLLRKTRGSGLPPHVDHAPPGVDRLQLLMVQELGENDGRWDDCRAFCYVEGSWKYWSLFWTFMKVYKDPKIDPTAAPCFMKTFDPWQFNSELSKLKSGSDTGLVSDWRKLYSKQPDAVWPKALPKTFRVVQLIMKKNTMVVFCPYTIHWVTPGNAGGKAVFARIKGTFEVHASDFLSKVVIASTDGKYKAPALKFEEARKDNDWNVAKDVPVREWTDDEIARVKSDLADGGVSVISDILEEPDEFVKSTLEYLFHGIMKIDKSLFCATNPKDLAALHRPDLRESRGITNANLTRTGSTMTTIVAKSAGNTGMGCHNLMMQSLQRNSLPNWERLFGAVFGKPYVLCCGCGINPQTLY